MSQFKMFIAVAAASIFLAACAGPLRGPQTFPGYYRTGIMDPAPRLPACAAYPMIVVDASSIDRSNIGQRYEENKPGVRYPIAMQNDVRQYFAAALKMNMDHAGPNPTGPSVPVQATVTAVNLVEKTYHNAEFSGTAELDVSVMTATGQVCWRGHITGKGDNYGRAGSEENYEETLARTADVSARKLIMDPGFSDALCGKCGSAAGSMAPLPTR